MDSNTNAKWFPVLVQRAGFPLLLGVYAIGLYLMPALGVPLLLGAGVLGFFIEKRLPYHSRWQGIKDDSRLDGAFTVLTMIVSVAVKGGLTLVLAHLSFELRFWPALPLPLSILLALIVSSFGPYVLHRASHEWSDVLWQIHAVHHAPERVYSLNAMRAHPLNAAWNVIAGLGPLLLLGADSQTILIAGGLNNFFSIFNHMNINFRNPLLSVLLNTAELHRWHHSARREYGDSNYSSGALTFWDHAFGTWKLPVQKFAWQDAGLYSGKTFPSQSLSRQLLRPLCRCA